MTSYLLDTNHVSGILRKNTKLLNRMAGTADAEYGIPLPAIGELWFMVYNSDRIAQNSGPLQQSDSFVQAMAVQRTRGH